MSGNVSGGRVNNAGDAAAGGARPMISVGMPVYNGEQYVASAVQAILDQTYGDFELIISDNASDDGTESICRELAASDSRIRYYRNSQNIGAARNYNRLVDLARGPYFRWSNADDLFAPELHERCLEALEANPGAVLSYGGTDIIDEHGKTTRTYNDNLHITDELASDRLPRYFEQVGLTNAIYGLMRTDAVRRTSVFGDATLPAADIDFMAELILLGGFIEVPGTLFYRRMHAEASSADRQDHERHQRFWRGHASPFKLPVLRRNLRYLRRVWGAPITLREKFRLTTFILRRLVSLRSHVASELVGVFRRG
jgi:glycosyltransferase involved in cell wall biosynthesis